MPTGGPLDKTPPKVIKTEPKNFSVNFKNEKVEIFFNEFVQLKDVNENFVVSPPFKKQPIVKLKGKSILIKLEEDLKENTTYTLDFGTGITDNNEGNPLGEFQFVFSTGPTLDSLSIRGKIDNSFNQLPVEKSIVMAYLNTNDSVPYSVIPDYISKTDSAGNFKLNNLREGEYKLFALVDGNRDYLYNGPGEMIGFNDEIIHPTTHQFEQIDSLSKDSVVLKKYTAFGPSDVHIRMFDEENPLQYLTSYKRVRREKLEFEFNAKRSDSLQIDFIGIDENPNWFLQEKNSTNDTLAYWIIDSSLYKRDTLLAELQYLKTDSAGTLVSFKDTVKLNFKEAKQAKQSKSQKKKLIIKKPVYQFKLKTSSTQDLNKDLIIDFEEPLALSNLDSIGFFEIKDTLMIPVEFQFFQDSLKALRYHIAPKWKPETQYKIEIDSAAFQNVFGLFSDRYNGKITTRDKEYYGKLFLNVTGINEPILVQLLKPGKNEKLIQSQKISSDQTVLFDYVAPETYIIKVIVDKNNNGKWDTGDYKKNLQPEMVHYFRKEIKIRSNWEVEDRIQIPAKGHEFDYDHEPKPKVKTEVDSKKQPIQKRKKKK